MYPICTKVRRVLWGGEKVYRLDGFISEDRRGKRSPVHRAGIDIQSVWTLVGDTTRNRRVSVNDEAAEVLST